MENLVSFITNDIKLNSLTFNYEWFLIMRQYYSFCSFFKSLIINERIESVFTMFIKWKHSTITLLFTKQQKFLIKILRIAFLKLELFHFVKLFRGCFEVNFEWSFGNSIYIKKKFFAL